MDPGRILECSFKEKKQKTVAAGIKGICLPVS